MSEPLPVLVVKIEPDYELGPCGCGQEGALHTLPPRQLGELADQTRILGDIISPVVAPEEWEVLRP